jgi:hypothetical protein
VLLSRFWYVLLSVAGGALVFLLFLAQTVTNRASTRSMSDMLTSATNAVGWYLKDDANQRTVSLIPLALDPDVRDGLKAANEAAEIGAVNRDVKDKARKAIKKFADAHSPTGGDKDMVFDAVWAIDVHGRVLANVGYEQGTTSKEFEMGGYAVVADAIHGWIRDDAWVFDEKIYRVVARPVEIESNGTPVGAVVAAKVVDDRYAQDISERTGSAVAFFAGGTRVATGAPSSFDKADLEVNPSDIAKLESDPDYEEKGRTAPRVLRELPGWNVGAIFARMPGEAWDLHAGYVVGNRHPTVRSPFDFQNLADEKDKAAVPLLWIALGAAGAALLGLIFSILEHSLPLHTFRKALAKLANRDTPDDVMKPASFRGVYKKFAALVNDALDKIAAKGGVERGVADLKKVLGPLPAQPQLSAFAVPQGTGVVLTPTASSGSQAKRPRVLPGRKGKDGETDESVASSPEGEAGIPPAPSSRRDLPKPTSERGLQPPAPSVAEMEPVEADGGAPVDEETEWRSVFKEFVGLKKKLGEPTESLTYEKFRGTLQRNKDALVARHGCSRVQFRVYEKQGKTALKASPVK